LAELDEEISQGDIDVISLVDMLSVARPLMTNDFVISGAENAIKTFNESTRRIVGLVHRAQDFGERINRGAVKEKAFFGSFFGLALIAMVAWLYLLGELFLKFVVWCLS
jgi:hypothetical protein